jgi:ankyrin repeat protein
MLKCGVAVNNCYKDGSVPLWTAIYYNHKDIVQLLVENGANIEQQCYCPNFNALDYAILYGRYSIALYLYNAAQNQQLKTAEQYERMKKDFSFVHYTDYSLFIQGLLKGTP